jgi:hypothetical protein
MGPDGSVPGFPPFFFSMADGLDPTILRS